MTNPTTELSTKIESHSESPVIRSETVVAARVAGLDYDAAMRTILERTLLDEPGYVCAANVHVVMEAHDDPKVADAVNSAFMVTSDGMPLVWALRLLGLKEAQRVYGPTLTRFLCAEAANLSIPVGFYGSEPAIVERMITNLLELYPGLNVVYRYSPPFRKLSPEEDSVIVEEINRSGARLLFVGLGCPKQELWMAEHKDSITAIMLGVGAAFDFIAGNKPQAPAWPQNIGLEWLFRLVTEPKRLWRRYLYHNPRFVYHFMKQLLLYRQK